MVIVVAYEVVTIWGAAVLEPETMEEARWEAEDCIPEAEVEDEAV